MNLVLGDMVPKKPNPVDDTVPVEHYVFEPFENIKKLVNSISGKVKKSHQFQRRLRIQYEIHGMLDSLCFSKWVRSDTRWASWLGPNRSMLDALRPVIGTVLVIRRSGTKEQREWASEHMKNINFDALFILSMVTDLGGILVHHLSALETRDADILDVQYTAHRCLKLVQQYRDFVVEFLAKMTRLANAATLPIPSPDSFYIERLVYIYPSVYCAIHRCIHNCIDNMYSYILFYVLFSVYFPPDIAMYFACSAFPQCIFRSDMHSTKLVMIIHEKEDTTIDNPIDLIKYKITNTINCTTINT